MDLETGSLASIAIATITSIVALLAVVRSRHQYDLQVRAFEIQKKDAAEKHNGRLQIVDEQFLSSHTLGPMESAYYAANPEEIEFEYRGRYENKGLNLLQIKSMSILVRAVEVKNFFDCQEPIVENRGLLSGESIDVCHRILRTNLDGFKSMVDHISEKRGVIQFEIKCEFAGLDQVTAIHQRVLYRLTEGGGDISCKGYDPGHGKNKHNFSYCASETRL